MLRKQGVFFFVFSFITLVSHSQGSISIVDKAIVYDLPKDTLLERKIYQSKGFANLTKEEKDVVFYLNYARQNPKVFLQKVVNVFLANHPELHSEYSKSLQKTLYNQPPLKIVFPDSPLSNAARKHAVDLRTHNIISHQSSDGRGFQERIGNLIVGCGSECIHAAAKFNSIEAIMFLLFDFNVPNLGHRKAILDPRFSRGGVGVSVAPKGNTIVVIDFSCE